MHYCGCYCCYHHLYCTFKIYPAIRSAVVKDLRLKDEDKDKESSFKDMDKDLMSKDEDLKIGPRGQGLSSRTTTL